MLGVFYAYLFYLLYATPNALDFLSFYVSGKRMTAGDNPYTILTTIYAPIKTTIAANLNPPLFIWLFSPLVKINYPMAIIVWSCLSFILGFMGVRIVFTSVFSPHFIKKHGFYLYFYYCCSFPILMNVGLAQFGLILLFLAMMGYQSYMKNQDYIAGMAWGTLIALKFFPALLLIYALVQKRYRVGWVALCTALILSLIPWIVFGAGIYRDYFAMLSQVTWYGKSWNGSIWGLIYRLLPSELTAQSSLLIITSYGLLFCLLVLFYLKKIISLEKSQAPHQSFCLTLVMMLFLSPLGWLYYFPLLLFPICLTWINCVYEKPTSLSTYAWYGCLMLINAPINNLALSQHPSLLLKLTIYSLSFYGLVIMIYLTVQDGLLKTVHRDQA